MKWLAGRMSFERGAVDWWSGIRGSRLQWLFQKVKKISLKTSPGHCSFKMTECFQICKILEVTHCVSVKLHKNHLSIVFFTLHVHVLFHSLFQKVPNFTRPLKLHWGDLRNPVSLSIFTSST